MIVASTTVRAACRVAHFQQAGGRATKMVPPAALRGFRHICHKNQDADLIIE